MNKIPVIIRREYLTRVKKKSFIIMTLLSPLLIAALIFLPMWLAKIEDREVKNIIVIDKTGKYEPVFQSDEIYNFRFVNDPVQFYKNDKDVYALIVISGDLKDNPDGVVIYADGQVGLEFKSHVSRLLGEAVENEKLAAYDIPGLKQMIEESKTTINVKTATWKEDGSEAETSSEKALITGMFTAFLIYFFILLYGNQVMRGIVEEKSNRIVEVIISSVKPFQLMIGKIIGIALVGLTQFLIWVFILLIIMCVAGGIFQPDAGQIMSALLQYNIAETGILFLLYFLGGYLLYASLFAAIGAASNSETDTQQFMIPITIPIIFALYAAIYSATNPDGSLAFWTSIIPFTSPVVMMVRIPLGVPVWQLIISLLILFVSFIGTTWLAAKIYRTGILMYGKKITYKEIWKMIVN